MSFTWAVYDRGPGARGAERKVGSKLSHAAAWQLIKRLAEKDYVDAHLGTSPLGVTRFVMRIDGKAAGT